MNVVKSTKRDEYNWIYNGIPIKVTKIDKDLFANFFMGHFNYCITYGEFPDELKHAVTTVQRKPVNSDKTNYRPVSILTSISKIYKKLMYN